MTHPRHQVSASKQARSAATRARLLDAALACLVDAGYAGSSTALVARRAGVSQGALYKHFPSKSVLWGLAAAHLFADLRRHFLDETVRRVMQDGADPIDSGLDVLWEIFCDERLHGVFELYLAARTDTAIAEAVRPVLAEHQAEITAIAEQLFPDKLAERATLEPLLWAVLNTMQGAALMQRVLPSGAPSRPMEFEFIKQIARSTLGAPTLPEVTA